MRTKWYSCPNGCKLPPRKKVLQEKEDHTYGFEYNDFNFCPRCGSLMPYSLHKLKEFFNVYNVHPSLNSAIRLLYKSEFQSAAREAFVVVETALRKKSGLDSHGFDLATKALKFEVDKSTGEVTKEPLIAINELKTESDKNEQNGVRYMLMGFFQGPRNLYQHNYIGSGVSNSISMIIDASFYLHLLDGHSITQNGKWIKTKVDYNEIYKRMPKWYDRLRLKQMLKKKAKIQNKYNNATGNSDENGSTKDKKEEPDDGGEAGAGAGSGGGVAL